MSELLATAKHKILVIEDSATSLKSINSTLKDSNFAITVCRDGKLGLLQARMAIPDIILLDVVMPEMNGFDVCQQLKQDAMTSNIPVIFMTSLNNTNDKVKGFHSGAIDYITKPIQPEELLARITTHLKLGILTRRQQEHALQLERTNAELENTLNDLQSTQAQLVEAEKLAALARMVAGVAHEINTPLGIGVTAASTLNNETQRFHNIYQQNTLKRSQLDAYLDIARHSSSLILTNLQHAAQLVQSFKQVAVDQTSRELRNFALKNYLEEIALSLSPELKRTHHKLTISGNENIQLASYPGILAQLITNLVMNSIKHAYQDGESGELSIEFNQQKQSDLDTVLITYSDDGRGIAQHNLARIFEPFFTTARQQGGSGLGLHIIYNLVTQTLQGSIRCESELGMGAIFFIELPQRIDMNEPGSSEQPQTGQALA